MGLFSQFFKKKENYSSNVISVENENDKMNWAIDKAKHTLHYFEKCLSNPKPLQQYFSIKVKITEGEVVEHIWLNNPNFDEDGNLFGIVGNDPVNVSSIKIDQKIGIEKSNISDWMILKNGRLIGGYTIRALREGLSGKDLSNFDKQLGGIFIDEGEDYFLPNFDSPESAIVAIEEAYNESNLEKAIECKDFDKEAELMLLQLKFEFNEEILKQTAEALNLSFIKSIQENGMPNFQNVIRAFPKREKISENHIIVTEILYLPNGAKKKQRLNTYRTDNGWKVLAPAD